MAMARGSSADVVYSDNFESGSPCGWSRVVGWELGTCSGLQIEVLENGSPLPDGALFRRAVTPVLLATGGTPPVTVSATLNGSAFHSGETIAADGAYTLVATAEDDVGQSASRTVHFAIDTVPPTLSNLLPADGTVTLAASVEVTGHVDSAVSLTIDGAPVPMSSGDFSAGPYALGEGDRIFLLVAADAAGNSTQVLLHVARDTMPPSVTISQPAPGVVGASPVAVAGSAVDPHLLSVQVNGRAAILVGASFSLPSLPLTEGVNTISAVASDVVGNTGGAEVSVTLDTQAPALAILENGEPLADGSQFRRTVVPTIAATDTTQVGISATLNGLGFVSGTPVEAEGEYLLSATATDAGGNSTTASLHFTIDETPPVLGTILPADGSLVGAAEITLTGQVSGAIAVTVDGAGASLAGDTFSAGPYALADGERTFEVRARDAAGNEAVRLHRIRRDGSGPALVVLSPAEGSFLPTAAVVATGTVSDPNLSLVTVNGVTAQVVGETFSAGPLALDEGPASLSVVATDAVANTTTVLRHLTVDLTPPVVRLRVGGGDLADGAVFNHAISPVVEVTDANDVTVSAELDGAPFVSGSPVGGEGQHLLAATATDPAGNATAVQAAFSLDATSPLFLALSPEDGAVTNGAEVTLQGRVLGASALTVDGAPVELVGSDFVAGPYALAEGERTFALVARDGAGNETTKAWRVTRDTAPPAVAISQPAAAAVLGSTSTTVVGSASDPHLATVTVNGVVAAVTGSSFVAAQVPLSEGETQVVATATDRAGNSATAGRTVVRDTTAPAITITDPAVGTVVPEATIRVAGTAVDEHLDRVEVGSTRASVTTGGAWQVTVPLAEGNNTLIARAFDRLGRSSEASVQVRRDGTAPALEITDPGEGARLRAESTPVRGTLDDPTGVAVTVNGVAAGIQGDEFSIASVPLLEGENRLIARARDAQGNEGVRTRKVFRDTVPPTLLSSDPASGALAVPTATAFVLSFSEDLAAASSSGVRLETAGGQALASSAVVEAAEIRLVASSLPAGTEIRLLIGGGVTDLAGNPLASPATLEFMTTDDASPAAPIVPDPPARFLCATAAHVAGVAEPQAQIVVEGGAGTAVARAGDDGAFAVDVQLRTSALNRLELTAVDPSGNVSPPLVLEVVEDCDAPFVERISPLAAGFSITFNEAIAYDSIAGAVEVSNAAGPIPGEVSLTTDTANFVATDGLPEGPIRVEVLAQPRDLAGNVLAYPYAQVFGTGIESTFATGTVLDDATGRPLPGARVEVVATDGAPVAEPRPQQTVGADGAFSIPIAAGTHRLQVSRPGDSPALRIVTTTSGQGADVLDPRLTALAPATLVTAAGGTVAGTAPIPEERAPRLEVAPGALATSASISVTGLSEQGLPALLPFGWSPRGAAWVESAGASWSADPRLTLPVESSSGAPLAIVHLEEESGQWRVLAIVAPLLESIEAAIPEDGAYAAVEADPPPFAVPPPVVGEALGSLPTPPLDAVASATLTFDPEVVLPAQQSVATVDYTVTETATSGLALTLSIAERLQLLDGSERDEPPFLADLVLYRSPAGGARSRFRLAPSEAARIVPLELGSETVSVRRYGGETVRGNVVGPGGGAVSDAGGDRIDIPTGALTQPTAVQLDPVGAGQLPLPLPAGFEFAGALRLSLSGRELLLPARLHLEVDAPPPAESTGLLFVVETLPEGPRWSAVSQIAPDDASWNTVDIEPADLPWPGVVRGGTFVFARSTTPLGFFRGAVLDVGGAPLARGVVTAIGRDWIAVSDSQGRYVFPAPLGASVLTATNRTTGNAGSATGSVSAAAERVDLDLTLAVVRPAVVATNPEAGAVAVPVGIEPTVRFSETVDRVSLDSSIALRPAGGSPIAVDLTLQGGNLLTVAPRATLEPGTGYELVIGAGVRDLQGYGLAAEVVVPFATQSIAVPSGVDLTRVLLYEPGATGEARIQGLAGAAPAGTLVFAENLTRLTATVSVTADQDGSFELTIAATVADRLLLHVLVPGGNEAVALLGPFLTSDGRGAYAPPEGTRFVTVDGWTVEVPEGAFAALTRVRVTPSALGHLPTPLPATFVESASFSVDFGGATAAKPLQLTLPAPAGVPAGRPILVLRQVSGGGRTGWMLHALGQLSGSTLTTEGGSVALAAPIEPLADGGAPAANAEGVSASMPSTDERQSAVAELAATDPGRLLPGIAFAGRYTISWTPEPLGFFAFPFGSFGDILVATPLEGIVTVLNRAIELLLDFDSILIPTLLGHPVPLEVRDAGTGFLLFAGEFSPPADDGGVIEIPPSAFGDTRPPFPVAGSPLAFHAIDVEKEPVGVLSPNLSYVLDDGTLTITGRPGAVGGEAKVHLLGLDDDTDRFTTADSDGSFELAVGVEESAHRFVVAVGARIDARDALEVTFDGPLAEGFPGIRVVDSAGRDLQADLEPVGTRATVRISPHGGWPTDRGLRLELGPELEDASGNVWEKTLAVEFTARGSRVLDRYPLGEVEDVARLGSWLFVAAGSQGLVVLDASDPAHLANALPGDLTFPLPLNEPVRGVAIDPHGRVLVAGGGVANFGIVRVFDPLKIPTIAAAPDPVAARGLAWRGTTIVSDKLGGTGTQLPSGTPRDLVVDSDDLSATWRAGEPGPSGLEVTLVDGGEGELPTLHVAGTAGNGAVARAPVSLFDRDRGSFRRVDADAAGAFALELPVESGDRIELLRNRETIAYVATLGAGLEAVDVNAFYEGADTPTPAESKVIGVYSGIGDPNLFLCDDPASDLAGALLDVEALFEANASPPIDLVGLVAFRGLAEIESSPADAGDLAFFADACAEVEGSRAVWGLATEVDLPWDANGNGKADPAEVEADYAFVAHGLAGLLIFDLTDRANPILRSRIRVPMSAVGVAIDRRRMRAYVSGASSGVAIVDLAEPATTTLVDRDGDGIDDRVLEVLPIPDARAETGAIVEPDLGIVFTGGEGGVTSLAVDTPAIGFVATLPEGGEAQLAELAPLGVPTRNVGSPTVPRNLPATFRVRASLPGFVGASGEEPKLDLAGVGPGHLPLDGAGDPTLVEGLPTIALAGDEAIALHRLAESPWEEGSRWFRSDLFVAVADLRAAKGYLRTEAENEPGRCVRCDRAALSVPESAQELLSGDAIRASWSAPLFAELSSIYEPELLKKNEAEVDSVRWETSPALRQEPAQNPSFGSGDVVPGTLLHSGEFTQGAVDLAVKGRGLDFAFARSYRSQTVGSSPLGPGWDFGYRLRLRKLPNGDVELYDGRGRRETFPLQSDGTLKSPTGVFSELTVTPTGFVLIDPSHTLAKFDRSGRLAEIDDPVADREGRGNRMKFVYDDRSRLVEVRDALEREVDLTYDDAGRLTELRDFDGREVVYHYDPDGRLASVTGPKVLIGESQFPDGLTTAYRYEAPAGDLAHSLARRDNLVAMDDPRGETPWEITYTDADDDQREEEATAETWGGHGLTIAYDFEQHKADVTDRRQNVWKYTHEATGQAKEVEDPLAAKVKFTIDSEGLVTQVEAPLGRKTEVVYDTGGSRRSRGNATTLAMTADGRGSNGSSARLETFYAYEAYSNQPIRIRDARQSVTEITRDSVGLPLAITEATGTPEAGTTRFSYNEFGQPISATNPNHHETKYEYFETGPSRGYLQKSTVDPAGLDLETTFETDPRGNVTATTDARKVRSESTFNELDWLVSSVQAASASDDGAGAVGYETTSLFDADGNVIEERIPFGDEGASFTRVQRDYGILNEVTESRAEVTPGLGDFVTETRGYDENFNLVSVTDAEGQRTTYAYDERNQLASVTRGDGTPEEITESYGYDAEGSRTSFTNGRNFTRSTIFDGFGRVAATLDPLGNRSEMSYDDGGNLTDSRSLDATGLEMSRGSTQFDRRGRPTTSVAWLWQGTDPAGARAISSTTTYDAAGNVLSTKDPLGRSSSQTYDSAERRLAATDAAGNRTEWTLDKMGNAISTTMVEQVAGGGPVTSSISTAFDALGRPTASSDPLGNGTTTIYDARGNVRMAIDAEGHFTESIFDGLDRLTRTVRPEGISIDYGYDRQSRLTSYRDALGNTTRWTYDALNRKRTTTYPGQTHESIAYDGAGNATGITDGAGNVIAQGFDGADRLTSRTVAPAAGFEGPTAETFGYDGLSRPTHQQIGALATDFTYDSLGRTLSETTNGKTTSYQPDDAGNVVRTTYPSGVVVHRSVDPLNRPGSISSESGPLVSYGYRGPDLVATKGLGNGLLGAMTYDAARRPIVSAFAGSGFRPFEERLSWSPRSLKTAISRSDENGRGFVAAYDGAGRLVTAAVAADPLSLAPNNTSTNASALAGIPESFNFQYDAAENLIEQRPERYAISSTVSSPNDGSGRNRPGSFNGQPLAWDGNGNLIQKGPLHLFWDYRNRLVRVTKDGTGELARYEYDSTNRLTKRTAQGHQEDWVWSGWQLIERYRDGELAMRRIYGQSLDEVVRQESDLDGNGTLESVVVPVYDSIGNVVALTDAQGKPIERQDFTPYGGKTTTVDLTPPVVEQLREAHNIEGSGPPIPDALLIEFSEEILLDRVQQAIATGHLTLTDTETSEPIELSAEQPVRDGKQRGRRLLLEPNASHPPAVNHGMLLHIDPEAVVDLFENRMATAYERAFPWLGADHAIEDATPPRVELLLTKQGELELQFSEEISPVVASGVILLDGAATPWELEADGYTLKPTSALSATTHTLAIGPSLHDLAGNALAEPFSRAVTTGGPDQIVFERQDPRLIAISTVDNLASFQGHIQDPASGLVYMRNRWMDAEMGRFVSDDPNLYADSGNAQQFAVGSPLNALDPMGEEVLGYASTRDTWGSGYELKDRDGVASDMSFVERAGDRVVVMAHGYNLNEGSAAATFRQVDKGFRLAGAEQSIEGFTWNGDPAGEGTSGPLFALSELMANRAGLAMARFLGDIRHRSGSGQDLFVMTHSLGARVALTALNRIAAYRKSALVTSDYGLPIDGLFMFNAAVPESSLGVGGELENAFDAVSHVYNFYSAKDPVLGALFPLNQLIEPYSWRDAFNPLRYLVPGAVRYPAVGSRALAPGVRAGYQGLVADRDMTDPSVAGLSAATHSDHLNPAAWRDPIQRTLYVTLAKALDSSRRASKVRLLQ
jgi:RHS repeat-associated protein